MSLSKIILDKIVTMANWFDQRETSMENLSWLKVKHDLIAKQIENRYRSLQTKRLMYYALCAGLKHLNHNEDNELVHKYRTAYTDLSKRVEEQVDTQTLQGEEKFTWQSEAQLIKLREYWLEQSEHGKYYNEYRKYLCLCLYTLQPPIRGEWSNMRIIHNATGDDGKDNVLLVNAVGEMTIILNAYKTVKLYGKKRIPVTLELTNVIQESLRLYPRTYVLGLLDNPNSAIGNNRFIVFLASITKGISSKRCTVDNMRSAYITAYYAVHPLWRDRANLAQLMCNSVESASRHYDKIGQV